VIPLRARLVFATHQNLADMVVQGTFRQDFYYRINVVRIDAPALREHSEDIPQIATHLLHKYSEMFQKPASGIDREAIAALRCYSWPGNVRELENVIQRAIVVSASEQIRLEDLPSDIQEQSIPEVVDIDDYLACGSFERQLRNYKIKLATTALRENKGNKTLAARSLNISRAYLHRLIRGIDSDAPADSEIEFEPVGPEAETA
jgi:transcriptional regulator with PAS, ATPase and Fis domain